MNVLLVAAEAHPFIKTGGLGDVMGALPKALSKIGVDARVVIPNYKNINWNFKKDFKFIKWFFVKVGWRTKYCGVFEYKYGGVTYYFLDNEEYFNRDTLYGHFDDGERFAFFDRAAIQFLREINWHPDVIHCNDWQTGMIPVLLRLEYGKFDDFYRNIKTVYSIHNIVFQGAFDRHVLPELFGYNFNAYDNKTLEYCHGVSYMKGGINYSDKVSTVSYSYAKEIQTPQYGHGLDGLLRQRSYALRGILNGIDYDEYNPWDDNFIYQKYNYDYRVDKNINKTRLQKELGLPVRPEVPMLSIVSRLTEQKGMNLVLDIAQGIVDMDVQLVILGTGDKYFEDCFRGLQYHHPDKVSAQIKFDNGLAHKIYAGSDIFLMPSLFEPCGLGQLIALRYGTIPVVRETGGLKDTINPFNEYTGEGNGFSFRNFNAHEFYNTVAYAVRTFHNKWNWNMLIDHAVNSNNSWEKSAWEYKGMYEEVMRFPYWCI